MPPERSDRWTAAGTAVALFLLYWSGRCPSFGGADSPQHVLSAVTWGVSWPPGYPLYVMLGRLAACLPGSAPGNVSALSGLLHALAAALFYLTLRRFSVRPAAALAGTALLALSPLYWYYSELGEVRALNDLLALACAYWAAAWVQERRPAALRGLAVCAGLGLSHHPTFVFILPALGYWLWRHEALPAGRAAWARFAGLLALCVALPYLVLGLRLDFGAPAYNLTSASGLRDMPALFLRKDLGGLLRVVAGRGVLDFGGFDLIRFRDHVAWFLRSAWRSLGWPGAALAALGAAAWGQRRRELVFWGLWLGAAAGAYLLLGSQQLRLSNPAFAYAIAARFHLLPLLAAFAVAALGADRIAGRLGRWSGALPAAAVAVCAFSHPVSLRRTGYVMDYAREMVRSSGPSDMIILTSDASAFALLYLDLVEHSTGDRVLLVPSLFGYPPYQRWLARRHPSLAIPPGFAGDWADWTRLNPSRALLAEAESWSELRGIAMQGITLPGPFPGTAPWGVLIRASVKPPAPEVLAEGLRRLLEWRGLSSRELYPFSPEADLLNTYRLLLTWGLQSLPPGSDPALAERLRKRFDGT